MLCKVTDCTEHCLHYCVTCTHVEKKVATAVRALQLFSVGQYSAQYTCTCLLVTVVNQISPYLTNQQLLLNTYTFNIKLNADLHCIHYVMMLYLFCELTKQSLGTTSWPNVFITASFRFRITSVLLLWVPSTPFLSSTKTHVYWESE